MGNRILKESIRTSRTVNEMTDFQFRLWAYLITYVDDYGRGSADPEILKGFVFPRRKGVTEASIQKALAEMATAGIILLYEADGESYLCFPRWSDHQRIQQKRSKFPPPPEDYEVSQKSTATHGDSPPEPISEPISESNPKSNTKGNNARGTRFTPPTVEDVQAFISENGYPVDAERFVSYYESNGWRVGKNPMKDWQATVRTWARRDSEQQTKTVKANPALDYQMRPYSDADYGDDFFVDLTAGR